MTRLFTTRPVISLTRPWRPSRKRVAVPVAVAGGVTDLDVLVRDFVCPVFERCVELVDQDTRHAVLREFHDLATTFDIRHGVGYVLRALLGDDPWTALRLAEAFDAYNAALDRIRDAIGTLPDTPRDPTA